MKTKFWRKSKIHRFWVFYTSVTTKTSLFKTIFLFRFRAFRSFFRMLWNTDFLFARVSRIFSKNFSKVKSVFVFWNWHLTILIQFSCDFCKKSKIQYDKKITYYILEKGCRFSRPQALTKLTLAGNNLINNSRPAISDIPAGGTETSIAIFYSVHW